MFRTLLFVLIMSVWMESKAQEKNVALNQRVTFISNHTNVSFFNNATLNLLVDGVYARRFVDSNCIRKRLRAELGQFRIDLNTTYAVTRIVTYGEFIGGGCAMEMRAENQTVGNFSYHNALPNVTFPPIRASHVDIWLSGRHCWMQLCEVEVFAVPVCSTNPCPNNAICNGSYNNHTCVCGPGYSGRNCELNIDECVSTPCLHGGNCTDLVNDFRCTCLAGFSGHRCETDIDECARTPCLSDGKCTDQVNGFNCTCKPGYTGDICETDIDDCIDLPCLHDGICIDQVNGFNCSCKDGYAGGRCENDIEAAGYLAGHSSGLRTGLGAGVGAGLGLALIAVLLVVGLLFLRHRRNRSNDNRTSAREGRVNKQEIKNNLYDSTLKTTSDHPQAAYDVIKEANRTSCTQNVYENFQQAPTLTQQAVTLPDTTGPIYQNVRATKKL